MTTDWSGPNGRVYVIGAARAAIGKFGGALAGTPAVALGWDWDRVNVNGGAIALGHPIGASGARIAATLLCELRRRSKQYGLATLRLGGGGSVAMAFERI